MEEFDEVVHRVIEEHRSLKVTQLSQMLIEGCTCSPKHTPAMVIRSPQACEYVMEHPEALSIDACLWMLDDIHDTIFPDHESVERLN